MKNLTRKLCVLMLVFAFAVIAFPSIRARAATLQFVKLDGTPIANIDNTGTWSALQTAVDTALGSTSARAFIGGDTLYAVSDGTTVTPVSATNPSDMSAATVVVLTQDDETQGRSGRFGTAGKAVWYISGTNLRILGDDVINDSTGNGTVPLTLNFVSTGYEIAWPSRIYSYTNGTDTFKFFKDPELGDERSFETSEYYVFEDPATKTSLPYMKTAISERAGVPVKIGTDNPRFDNRATFANNPPWLAQAATLTSVYIGSDIDLTGNMNFLFNQTSSDTKMGSVKTSAYTALKDVYLLCDTSGVTSCAGMFARCPQLEHIYCSNSAYFPNTTSTAYMFYGDEKLVNGTTEPCLVDHIQPTGDVLVDASYMFAACSSIEHPAVSSYGMGNVTSTAGMFFGAKKAGLISVSGSAEKYNIAGWQMPHNVNAMFMFAGNIPKKADGTLNLDNPWGQADPGLDAIDESNTIVGEVDMTGWEMSELLVGYMMFSQDGGITKAVLSDSGFKNYTKLIDASGMFLRCDNLKDVSMPECQMPALKNSTSMFRLAGSKSTGGTADLSGWGAGVITNADLMFYGSGFGMINLNGSSDFSTLQSSIGMFGQAKGLKNLGSSNLSHARFENLAKAQYMFYGDPLLQALSVENWDMSRAENISHMFADCPSLSTGVTFAEWLLGKNVVSPKTLEMDFFLYNTAVTTADLSQSQLKIVTTANMAFANNPVLSRVIYPEVTADNDQFGNVRTALGAFADNPQLTGVTNLQKGTRLQDARGMFANDTALTSLDAPDLLTSNTTWATYMFKNDNVLTAVNAKNWVTSNIVYMQGIFDGCWRLRTITTQDNITGGSNLADMGTAFRDCYLLLDDSVNGFLKKMNGASSLVDVYEMCKNCYALSKLDLSGMNFSATTVYDRMAAMEELQGVKTNNLVTIVVPESFLSAATGKTGTGESVNIFWVDGDGDYDGGNEEDTDTEDLLTAFFVAGSPNANTLDYSYGGRDNDNDNRSFVKFKGRTINGQDIGSYSLETKTDSATLFVDAESTFYTGGTSEATAAKSPLKYSWERNGKDVEGATSDTLVVTGATAGDYIAHAAPAILTSQPSRISVSFLISAPVESIKAVYNGPEITVGTTYSKDHVTVTAVDQGGNPHTLLPSDFTVSGLKVTKKGNNKFTAYYQSDSGTLQADFTVPGVRRIGSIVSEYTGPSVLVGSEYDTEYVVTTAYYVDDTKKREGFEVEETSFSGRKVGKVGDNIYTVTYEDPDQGDIAFTDTISVNGYKQINSISATYVGKKIKVGRQYSKSDVIVTLYYTDGSGSTKTTNFTLDSRTVTEVGENSYLATYRDPFGTTYTAGFTVPGYDDEEPAKTNNTTPAATTQTAQKTEEDPLLNSSVLPPSQQSADGSGVGTYTGVVQTGRTQRTIRLILIMAAIVIAIGGLVYYRHKLVKGGKDKKK